MADNVLLKIVCTIRKEDTIEQTEVRLNDSLKELEKIYSFIVYQIYNEEELIKYTVQYSVSQTTHYNTLCYKDVISKVLKIIYDTDRKNSKKVIGYGQPPVEIALEAFDPYVHKLAKYEKNKWSYMDYEDLCQTCRLVMIKLYKKGYYVHKRLLQKAFNNEILMSIRHEKNSPSIVSFEDCFYSKSNGDSEDLTVADTVPDISIAEQQEEEYRELAEHLIFEEVKEIVVDLIGIRQWNELMRDYGNKHTTARTRKLMQKIKHHFETLGISRKDFDKKYYG